MIPRGGHVFAVDATHAQVVDGHDIRDLPLDEVDVAVVPDPPGRELARIATISDLHIGETGFGILPRVREPRRRYADHFTVRAARAAIDEAVGWGAELIVVKGDLTYEAAPLQWERVAALLAAAPVPVVAVVGNHDVTAKGQEGRPWLEDAGIALVDHDGPAAHVDVDGMRVVIAHTTTYMHGPGLISPATRDAVVGLVDERPDATGAIVVVHHYPDRFAVPTRYPVGIRRDSADPFLRMLARAKRPPTLVTCGHSHRNRRYERHGLAISEVGSTKDYPGVWAGYVVHEGGLRQVVRRIAEPTVVEWVERTKRSCLGLWGEWTPGRLPWRCFSLPWREGFAAALSPPR